MPLVDPVTQSSGDKTSEWMSKLVGKKIGDASNETVSKNYSFPSFVVRAPPKSDLLCSPQTFAKTDLPQQHRVLKEGDMMTMDHNPNR